MAYLIKLWTPCEDGSKGLEMRHTVACPTMTAAWNCATRLLEPYKRETTWELRGYGPMLVEAEIFRPDGSKATSLYASVEYVDSIATRLRRGETVVV